MHRPIIACFATKDRNPSLLILLCPFVFFLSCAGSLARSPETATIQPSNVLLGAADNPVMAKTSMGYVLCKSGCAAYCIDTGEVLAVYNLHSMHKDDVQVLVTKQIVHTNLGEVFVCSKSDTSSFDQLNPADNVGYRNIRPVAVPGCTAFAGEFSIPSVIMRVESLRKLLNSGTCAEKKLLKHLLKNTVVLERVTAGRGAYKQRCVN